MVLEVVRDENSYPARRDTSSDNRMKNRDVDDTISTRQNIRTHVDDEDTKISMIPRNEVLLSSSSGVRLSTPHSYTKEDSTSTTLSETTGSISASLYKGDDFLCQKSSTETHDEIAIAEPPSWEPLIPNRGGPRLRDIGHKPNSDTMVRQNRKSTQRPRAADLYYDQTVSHPIARFPSDWISSSLDASEISSPNARNVSLFDSSESFDEDEQRDEELSVSGSVGDDERDEHSMFFQMNQTTMQYQQSHDDSFSSASFAGALPKFSQGPMSHVRTESSRRTGPKPQWTSRLQTSTYSLSEDEFLSSVEQAEKSRREGKETQSTSQTCLLQTVKKFIYCIPGISFRK